MADNFGFTIYAKDKATATLRRVDKAFGAQSKSAKSAAASMAKWAVGVVGVYASYRVLTGFLKENMKLATFQLEQERVLTAKYGESAQAIFDKASAVQRLTTVGDEQSLAGARELSYYDLSIGAINKLIPAMADAAAGKLDIRTSLMLLGRAMKGQYQTFTRYGIVMNEAQRQTLTAGTEMEKAAVLADLFKQRYGGLAETIANSVDGAWIQLKNAFSDTREDMGKFVMQSSAMKEALSGMAGIVSDFNDSMGDRGLTLGKAYALSLLTLADSFLAVAAAASATKAVLFDAGYLKRIVEPSWFGPAGQIYKMIKDGKSKSDEDLSLGTAVALKQAQIQMEKLRERVANMDSRALDVPDTGRKGAGPGAGGATGKAARMGVADYSMFYRQEMTRAHGDYLQERASINTEHWQRWLNEATATNNAVAEQWAVSFKPRITEMSDYMAMAFNSATGHFGRGLSEVLVDGKTDTQELGKGFLRSMIATTAQLLIQLAIWKLITHEARTTAAYSTGGASVVPGLAGEFALGGITGGGGSVMRMFHKGGFVGAPRAHSGMYLRPGEVPLIAQRGEFVMRREAVNAYGVENMKALNAGNTGMIQRNEATPVNINVYPSPGMDIGGLTQKIKNELLRLSENGEICINAAGVG